MLKSPLKSSILGKSHLFIYLFSHIVVNSSENSSGSAKLVDQSGLTTQVQIASNLFSFSLLDKRHTIL